MKFHVTVATVITVILVTVLGYILIIPAIISAKSPSVPIRLPSLWRTRKGEEETRHLCGGTNSHLPDIDAVDGLSREALMTRYQHYGNNNEIICNLMVRMGNRGDGGWEVCDDEHFRPKPNCLVYSFGIDNDFSFDDLIAKYYGCEVHAFDPSMRMKDTRRTRRSPAII